MPMVYELGSGLEINRAARAVAVRASEKGRPATFDFNKITLDVAPAPKGDKATTDQIVKAVSRQYYRTDNAIHAAVEAATPKKAASGW